MRYTCPFATVSHKTILSNEVLCRFVVAYAIRTDNKTLENGENGETHEID